MPRGKPAGVRCVQLTDGNLCRLWGSAERPSVCSRLRPEPQMCGDSREHALRWLAWLERATAVAGERGEGAAMPAPRT